MGALDRLKKIQRKTLKFEKHPGSVLDLETKMHYLNGLALVMNEDGDISEKEEAYFTALINSFNLDSDLLTEFIEFAKEPDEDMLIEMINKLKTEKIKYTFLFDCMILSKSDDNFDADEKLLVEQYADMLALSTQEIDDIDFIFEKLDSKDEKALHDFFLKSSIKRDWFEYIFDSFDINPSFKPTETEVISFEFVEPTFRYGGLQSAKKIMKNPVTVSQFCIFLNTMLETENIILDDEKNIMDINSKLILLRNGEVEIADGGLYRLKTVSPITYYDNKFIVDELYQDNPITNVTFNGVKLFIDWANALLTENYKISEFFGDDSNDYGSDELTGNNKEFYIYKNDIYVMNMEDSYTRLGKTSIDSSLSSPLISFRLMK